MHRDMKPEGSPEAPRNTLKNFRRLCIVYIITTFANVPNVIGHFGMMCNADITTMTSSKFTC